MDSRKLSQKNKIQKINLHGKLQYKLKKLTTHSRLKNLQDKGFQSPQEQAQEKAKEQDDDDQQAQEAITTKTMVDKISKTLKSLEEQQNDAMLVRQESQVIVQLVKTLYEPIIKHDHQLELQVDRSLQEFDRVSQILERQRMDAEIKTRDLRNQIDEKKIVAQKLIVSEVFQEKFTSKLSEKWSIVDNKHALKDGKSNWENLSQIQGVSQLLSQNSRIGIQSEDATLGFGSMIILNNIIYFDMQFRASAQVVNVGTFGFIFRYLDQFNFYSFQIIQQTNKQELRIIKMVNGELEILASNQKGVSKNLWYDINVECRQRSIKVQMDIHTDDNNPNEQDFGPNDHNMQMVLEAVDGEFTNGLVGFASDNVSPAVYYSRIQIKPLSCISPNHLNRTIFTPPDCSRFIDAQQNQVFNVYDIINKQNEGIWKYKQKFNRKSVLYQKNSQVGHKNIPSLAIVNQDKILKYGFLSGYIYLEKTQENKLRFKQSDDESESQSDNDNKNDDKNGDKKNNQDHKQKDLIEMEKVFKQIAKQNIDNKECEIKELSKDKYSSKDLVNLKKREKNRLINQFVCVTSKTEESRKEFCKNKFFDKKAQEDCWKNYFCEICCESQFSFDDHDQNQSQELHLCQQQCRKEQIEVLDYQKDQDISQEIQQNIEQKEISIPQINESSLDCDDDNKSDFDKMRQLTVNKSQSSSKDEQIKLINELGLDSNEQFLYCSGEESIYQECQNNSQCKVGRCQLCCSDDIQAQNDQLQTCVESCKKLFQMDVALNHQPKPDKVENREEEVTNLKEQKKQRTKQYKLFNECDEDESIYKDCVDIKCEIEACQKCCEKEQENKICKEYCKKITKHSSILDENGNFKFKPRVQSRLQKSQKINITHIVDVSDDDYGDDIDEDIIKNSHRMSKIEYFERDFEFAFGSEKLFISKIAIDCNKNDQDCQIKFQKDLPKNDITTELEISSSLPLKYILDCDKLILNTKIQIKKQSTKYDLLINNVPKGKKQDKRNQKFWQDLRSACKKSADENKSSDSEQQDNNDNSKINSDDKSNDENNKNKDIDNNDTNYIKKDGQQEKQEDTDDEKVDNTDSHDEKDDNTDSNDENVDNTDSNDDKDDNTDGNDEKDDNTDSNEDKDDNTDSNEDKDDSDNDENIDDQDNQDEYNDEQEKNAGHIKQQMSWGGYVINFSNSDNYDLIQLGLQCQYGEVVEGKYKLVYTEKCDLEFDRWLRVYVVVQQTGQITVLAGKNDNSLQKVLGYNKLMTGLRFGLATYKQQTAFEHFESKPFEEFEFTDLLEVERSVKVGDNTFIAQAI